jgi:hypothetical protein
MKSFTIVILIDVVSQINRKSDSSEIRLVVGQKKREWNVSRTKLINQNFTTFVPLITIFRAYIFLFSIKKRVIEFFLILTYKPLKKIWKTKS